MLKLQTKSEVQVYTIGLLLGEHISRCPKCLNNIECQLNKYYLKHLNKNSLEVLKQPDEIFLHLKVQHEKILHPLELKYDISGCRGCGQIIQAHDNECENCGVNK